MSTMGSGAGLVALLFTALLFRGPALQPGKSPVADINPYTGSVEFCSEHIVGRAGEHLGWTGYYSTDPPEKVVSHYMKMLGSKNHRKEGNQDIWRFPLDKPERVLTVTQAQGTSPRGQCRPPPGSARAIVTISMMTRPD